jgi:hypothetical protein
MPLHALAFTIIIILYKPAFKLPFLPPIAYQSKCKYLIVSSFIIPIIIIVDRILAFYGVPSVPHHHAATIMLLAPPTMPVLPISSYQMHFIISSIQFAELIRHYQLYYYGIVTGHITAQTCLLFVLFFSGIIVNIVFLNPR